MGSELGFDGWGMAEVYYRLTANHCDLIYGRLNRPGDGLDKMRTS